ncbi:hypothetical protein KM043_003936 [Ampulex compressa]|nr:hypothetical protein KM043_003936 [Ampulex compressa]
MVANAILAAQEPRRVWKSGSPVTVIESDAKGWKEQEGCRVRPQPARENSSVRLGMREPVAETNDRTIEGTERGAIDDGGWSILLLFGRREGRRGAGKVRGCTSPDTNSAFSP